MSGLDGQQVASDGPPNPEVAIEDVEAVHDIPNAIHSSNESSSSSSIPPAAGPNELIEPEEFSDVDSALGDDGESYTDSLISSITNYTYENGRRYHAVRDKSYFLPNDEHESDRLDLFHHILSLVCGGKLHMAPIPESVGRALDLGTGTGIWAIDMGDHYPAAEVIGIDISPIQPTLVPPNVRFEIDDIELDWSYHSKFDYIHSRYLAGAIKDWKKLLHQAYQSLNPGGWIEVQDFDMRFYTMSGEFKKGCPADRWTKEVILGLKSLGVEPEPGPKLEGWIRDTGFTNIHHHLFPIPVGSWPKDKTMKEIGTLDRFQFLHGLEAISLRIFTSVRNWKPEEVLVFLTDVRKDLKNPRLQAQHNFHVVYAQKPYE